MLCGWHSSTLTSMLSWAVNRSHSKRVFRTHMVSRVHKGWTVRRASYLLLQVCLARQVVAALKSVPCGSLSFQSLLYVP